MVAYQSTVSAQSTPMLLDRVVLELALAVRTEITGLDLSFGWDGDHLAIGFHDTGEDVAAERLKSIAARMSEKGLSLHAGLACRADNDRSVPHCRSL